MKTNLSDFIIKYDSVLTPDFCKEVCIKMDNDNRKKDGVTAGGVKKEVKNTVDLNISPYNDWKDTDSVFFHKVSMFIEIYMQDLKDKSYIDINEILDFLGDPKYAISDSGYQIQKYSTGGKYVWHHDYILNQRNGTRVLTYLFYLNDDFEGGETEFSDGTIIKPRTGTLLLFPSTWVYLHRGKEVTKGEKYIATGWLSHKLKN